MTGMDGSGRHYDEVNVGDAFRRSLTVTDTHLVVGAGLIGDFNPHHVDDAFASGTRFGTRILHGVLTSAIMGGAVGMIFHGTAVAYLEHATRFVAPVRAGDTLTTTWTVVGKVGQAEARRRHRRDAGRRGEPARRDGRRGRRQDARGRDGVLARRDGCDGVAMGSEP